VGLFIPDEWDLTEDQLSEEEKKKLDMAVVCVYDASKEISMAHRRLDDANRYYADVLREIQEAHETSD
jgi:hypothetical protein